MTGYSDKLVANALDYLPELGFVSCGGRYVSWTANTDAIQLPLAPIELDENSSRNNSGCLFTTTALIGEKDTEPLAVKVEKPVSRKISDSHKLLKAIGIGEPTAAILADIDQTSPYYIAGHFLLAQEDKVRINLLIHRMRSKDLSPKLNENYHLIDCDCIECDTLRFVSGRGLLEPPDFDVKCFKDTLSGVCFQ